MVLGQSTGLLFRIEAGPPINNHGIATYHSSLLRVRDCRRILRGQTNEYSRPGTIRSRVVTGEIVFVPLATRMLGQQSGSAPDCVVNHKDHDGADHSHSQTIDIQSGDCMGA